MSASVGGKTEIIKILLDKGAEINTADNDNRTALMWAAHYGHDPAVHLLSAPCRWVTSGGGPAKGIMLAILQIYQSVHRWYLCRPQSGYLLGWSGGLTEETKQSFAP